MPRTTDFAPLTNPITPAEIAAFRAEVRARPGYSSASSVITVIAFIFIGMIFGVLSLVAIASIGALIASVTNSPLAATVVALGLIGLEVFGAVWLIRTATVRRWQNWYRLDRFASRNSLVFSVKDADPQYPGAIFATGHSRMAVNHFRSSTARFLDYGNYRYTTGSGKNQSTHNWGFLAFQLDRSLPHMVLDSRANNGLFGGTNLPASFQKEQILSLEGDFYNYFTFYCPKAYERDALYVFTPDLMALLIDNVAPFDVEIIDKWMFVYSASAFDLVQPAVHHRLMSIVDTVGAKTLTQTDRYSDERVQNFAANVVAPQGQRLKKQFPLAAIIIVGVVVIGFLVVPMLVGLIAAFAR